MEHEKIFFCAMLCATCSSGMLLKIMRITGIIVSGKREGRAIGFPTANLVPFKSQRKSLPKEGIYAGTAVINLERTSYKAGIVITKDEKGRTTVGAYLIGFSGNLYGKRLTISLLHYLRPFKRFKTKMLLKKQIEKDIEQIGNLQ